MKIIGLTTSKDSIQSDFNSDYIYKIYEVNHSLKDNIVFVADLIEDKKSKLLFKGNPCSLKNIKAIDIKILRKDLLNILEKGSIDGFSKSDLKRNDYNLIKEYVRIYGIDALDIYLKD